MIDRRLYDLLVGAELIAAILTLASLALLTAPYGRHGRAGWGPLLPARWGWILMESPSFFGFAGLLLWQGVPRDPVPAVAAALFLGHYGYRTVLYPFLAVSRPMPWSIAASGLGFNVLNATIQAAALGPGGHIRHGPLGSPLTIAGAGLFVAGFVIHVHADHVLRTLRAPGDTAYHIPRRGLHRWVAAPNYLGEIVQWLGFAVFSGSGAAWVFLLFTIANLAPRAKDHLRWYRDRFPDYPADRRALLPGLW